jgi:hypothetical protein
MSESTGGQDGGHGLLEAGGLGDDLLTGNAQQVPRVVPVAHVVGGEGDVRGPCPVAADGLVEGDVEVEDVAGPGVPVDEVVQNGGVPAGVQDAFQHDVVTEVQGGARGRRDEGGRDRVGVVAVVFAQDDAAQVVLFQQGAAAAVPAADLAGGGGLAAAGVAADHHQGRRAAQGISRLHPPIMVHRVD